MNINATLVGELILIFALVVAVLSYLLALRKIAKPLPAALLGAVFGLFPPFGLVYLLILLLKKDQTANASDC